MKNQYSYYTVLYFKLNNDKTFKFQIFKTKNKKLYYKIILLKKNFFFYYYKIILLKIIKLIYVQVKCSLAKSLTRDACCLFK